MDQLIREALVQSTELGQTMSDLARTKTAEDLRKQRKVGKNRPVLSGESLQYLTGVEWFGSLTKTLLKLRDRWLSERLRDIVTP
ncbi:hypothetical protein E5D57_003302 [Metarhizium anisopliae]|nr:hypothetical protein E5D57_003302 [Metarhizium anisopliae]